MKAIQITVLAILGVIIILLSGLLIAGLLGYIDSDFSKFFGKSVLIFDETYDESEMKDIDIDITSANVKIYKSNDQSIRVVYYGPKSEKERPTVTADYVEGILRIEQKSRIQLFGFFDSDRVEIYLPRDYIGPFDFELSSGNLDFVEAFEFSQIEMQLTSGNVKAKTLNTATLHFVMSSGNLSCEGIYSDTYEIKMTSGTFKADALTGVGNFKSSSGNVSIQHYSGSGEIKLTSGDLNLGIEALSGDLEIGLSSGNVDVNLLGDTNDIACEFRVTSGNIRTNFGDVDDGDVGSKFLYKFSDGAENALVIKTISGSIRIEK